MKLYGKQVMLQEKTAVAKVICSGNPQVNGPLSMIADYKNVCVFYMVMLYGENPVHGFRIPDLMI